VLTSELYGIVYGFNIRVSIKATIKKILGISLPIVIYTDSRSLYDYLVKLGTT
jgi:hypothetical protein